MASRIYFIGPQLESGDEFCFTEVRKERKPIVIPWRLIAKISAAVAAVLAVIALIHYA